MDNNNSNENNFDQENINNAYENSFKNNYIVQPAKVEEPVQTKINNSGSSSVAKAVLMPFASGIVGAALVIAICFGVPSIKSSIIGSTSSSSSTAVAPTIDYNNINTKMVSISDYSDTGISVANKVLPSVVGIAVEYQVNSIFSRATTTAQAEGSGVIISADDNYSYILTNNHVISTNQSSSMYYSISEATGVYVYLYNDETKYEAEIVGKDEQTDLAVIKIKKTDLTVAELGDSSTVQVGEWCMAIGNPLGMKSTVTVGTISALNREITDDDGTVYNVIQTDTAINSGNSGGALVNSQGQIIGINTLKASGDGVEGLGFAIPINSTKSVFSDLIQYNKVKRTYIGITGYDVDESTIQKNPTAKLVKGIYVRSVELFSPAEKAGVKTGDIITKIDDTEVKNMNELKSYLSTKQIGDEVTLTINREGDVRTIKLTLAEQP